MYAFVSYNKESSTSDFRFSFSVEPQYVVTSGVIGSEDLTLLA